MDAIEIATIAATLAVFVVAAFLMERDARRHYAEDEERGRKYEHWWR